MGSDGTGGLTGLAVAPADDADGPSALFRTLVAEAREGIVLLGPNRVVAYANAAAEFLLGHRREDLVGEMFGLPLVAGDRPTRVNVLAADGRIRVVELLIEHLPAALGEGLVLRLRDVTADHQDVASAREEVRRRDEFLAMLSHELRNPLAAIQNAASLLTLDAATPELRREAGAIFSRQFRHLTRILDDLLDVTRVSRGKLALAPERLDLAQVVRDAVEAAGPLIRRRGHQLRVELPPQPLDARGDPTRLEQVVVNLLTNAAKFTPPGGRLAVSLSAARGEAELRVCDDGPGIPDDLLPHIFEPFVQGQQALARDAGGLGIGLALAQSLVALHGGSITARSGPDGRGTTFTVRLPLGAADAEPEAPPAPAPRPLRILLIEDNDDARRMLKQTLELDGHCVAEAADGPAGLAALLARPPDVALVDIGLPGLDGYEVARQARQSGLGGVKLIALTGYGMPREVKAAHDAGFDAHLIKPLRYPELCRLLAR